MTEQDTNLNSDSFSFSPAVCVVCLAGAAVLVLGFVIVWYVLVIDRKSVSSEKMFFFLFICTLCINLQQQQ
jgi:high-affinity Fe2+/Pb2+ permease